MLELPLLLAKITVTEKMCTFCSPGIDTSSGWTRTLSVSLSQERLEELQRSCRVRPCQRQWLSALTGVCIELWLEQGFSSSWYSALPAQASSTWECLPTAAELTKVVKSHRVIFLSWIIFPVEFIGFPSRRSQSKESSSVMGQETHKGFSSPVHFGSPCDTPHVLRASRLDLWHMGRCQGGTSCWEQRQWQWLPAPAPAQLLTHGFPWTANYTKALPTEQGLSASRIYVKTWHIDFSYKNRGWVPLSSLLLFANRAAEEEQKDLNSVTAVSHSAMCLPPTHPPNRFPPCPFSG